jgi:hypothetical protein
MSLALELFSAQHLDAARRFNQRLRDGQGDLDYLLPETVSPRQSAPEGTPFLTRQWILMDKGEARGGVLIQEMECTANGRRVPAANLQTPVTEGVFTPKGAHLGPVLIKLAAARIPLLYAVGMGSVDRPFPKMLRALRWNVDLSGFFFRAGRGSRFLRELAPLRKPGPIGAAAAVGAISGLGGPVVRFAHAISGWKERGFRAQAEELRTRPVEQWGEWATAVWESAESSLSFAAVRDVHTLPHLHPLNDGRLMAFRMDDAAGNPAGWAVLLCTTTEGGHFGRLRVGSIVDALARPGMEEPVLRAATRKLLELDAELLVANHTHRVWKEVFRQNGFLAWHSNYVVAASPLLAKAWGDPERVFVTRGDGDGRIHL